jgi:hypothetical protein
LHTALVCLVFSLVEESMTFAYTPGLLGYFFVEKSMTFASIPGFADHPYIMSVIRLVIYNTFFAAPSIPSLLTKIGQ